MKQPSKDGILSINKEALGYQEDSHITFADIDAKPGEDVRIVPVKEAAEPRPGRRTDFVPQVTGELAPCGEGELHALKGVSVLGVGKHWGSFGDGLVDMSGEGQKYTLFGSLINVCLVIDDDVEEERHEQQKKNRAIRWATHLFAEYLGKTVLEQTPDEVETYELPPVLHRGPEVERLPSVVLVMQPQSQMEEMGYNDLVYGWDLNHFVPTFMHPNEVLDGALISGSFMPASSKWATYDMQNFPIITELYKEHGKPSTSWALLCRI